METSARVRRGAFRLLIAGLSIATALGIGAPGLAAAHAQETGSRPRIALAAPSDWPPYSDPALPGGGLLPRLVAEAFREAGYAPTIVHLPLADARAAGLEGAFAGWIGAPSIAAVDSGPGDLPDDPAVLHSAPLATIEPVLVTHETLSLDWTGVGRLRGLTLCAPEGLPLPTAVLEAVAARGVDRAAPDTLADCAAAIRADPSLFTIAEPRRMAEAMRDAGLGFYALNLSPLPVASLTVGLAVSEVRPDAAILLADFADGLASLQADGRLASLREEMYAVPPLDRAAPRLLLWGQSEAGFPPYTLRFGANSGGFVPAVLEEIGRRTGHRFHRRYQPAGRGWFLFRQGALDVAAPVDPGWFGLDGPPGLLTRAIADTRDRLMVHADHPAAPNLAEADAMTLLTTDPVATVGGYSFAFADRMVQINRPDEARVLELVARGRVTLGVLEERVAHWLLDHNAVTLAGNPPPLFGPAVSEGTLHLLLHPQHGDILPDIDAALAAMEADGTLDRLRGEWLRPLEPAGGAAADAPE